MLQDDDLMPNGKYKGIKMIDIPADYLIWCYENNRCTKEVKEYIENNLDILKTEAKEIEAKKDRS